VTPNGQQLIWNVGSLGTNSGAQLTLVVHGNSTGSIVSSAIVNAGTPDPNPDDDSASATVNVVVPSAPQLSANFTGSNGAFKMTVTGTPGQNYTIQASTNLVTGPWISVFTNSGSFIFTDSNATNYPYRFYRALIGP
jgi:hypothetical protein